MALDVIYCLGVCNQSGDISRFMIQCDICKDWFHGRCVGVREYQAVDIDRFHCPRCEPYHGPSVLKARLNWHRHDYSEADAANKAVQTGTQVFIKELRGRHFHDCDKIITRLQGNELTTSFFAGDDGKLTGGVEDCRGGFTNPILVAEKTGLEMALPPPSFSVIDVVNYVGSDHEVDVIDVQRQTDVKMRLNEFIEYFQSPARTTVLNLISLEFSGTGLSQLVEPPSIVRELCWVNTSWPTDPPPPPPLNRPNVSKYCLIGVENSYTDFHIDFGGTSVWYHVLWGEKIFYLIKPTPGNILLYESWMKASNHSELFFGDQVDACYKCVVTAGQTLFIPTGWIHAVLTPTDTLVFGGNFLHSYAIDFQLQIYDLEQKMETPLKFRFPNYEEVCWFAGDTVLRLLRASATPPSSLVQGARALYGMLRQWLHQGVRGSGGHVPEGVSAAKLLKELQRELRSSEKQAVVLNPPRPERESKRRKKKQLAEDFVDYTNLTSFHTALEERLPKKEGDEYDSDEKHSLDQMKSESASQPQQQHSLQQQTMMESNLSMSQETLDEKDKIFNNGHESGIIVTSAELQSLQHSQQLAVQSPEGSIKLSMPRPTSTYPYTLLGNATDYGMSGTPPHDPDYTSFHTTEYPSNVKSEFEWAESPGVTPYRLARNAVGNSSTAHSTVTSQLTPLRLRIGRNSVEAAAAAAAAATEAGGVATSATPNSTPIFYYESPSGNRSLQPMTNPPPLESECDDDDEGSGLMIDENPVSRRLPGTRQRASSLQVAHDANKLKLSLEMCGGMEVVYGGSSVEVGGEVEVSQPMQAVAGHHNGIEELLRASAYAPAEFGNNNVVVSGSVAAAAGGQYIQQYRTIDEIDGSGRASPSTRDAIAGMLSMSRDVAAAANNSGEYGSFGGNMTGRHRLQSTYPRRHPGVATVLNKSTSRRYMEEESMRKVHQDDDYVYPTLDHSDDEDFPIFKPRGKKKEDEAWNPKARVRVWGPKPERPARLGVKKQAVEKGLEVAASRRNSQPAAKRAYHRKKGRGGGGGVGPMIPNSMGFGGNLGGGPSSGGPSVASTSSLSSVSLHNTVHHHRPKKGMATAKQRLGKILKIHKMIY